MRILIAEDLDDTREAMKLLLQLHGHEVVEALNGEQALQLATQRLPDLILMDLNMPIMDGISAIRHLRSKPLTSGITIFALSANSSGAGSSEQALAAGCDAYFSKPVDFDLLHAAISSALPVDAESLTQSAALADIETSLQPVLPHAEATTIAPEMCAPGAAPLDILPGISQSVSPAPGELPDITADSP